MLFSLDGRIHSGLEGGCQVKNLKTDFALPLDSLDPYWSGKHETRLHPEMFSGNNDKYTFELGEFPKTKMQRDGSMLRRVSVTTT